MAYDFFPINCHQRDSKRVRISQCIDDELFRVTTNWKVVKAAFVIFDIALMSDSISLRITMFMSNSHLVLCLLKANGTESQVTESDLMDAMTELPVSPFIICTAMCADNKDISPLFIILARCSISSSKGLESRNPYI